MQSEQYATVRRRAVLTGLHADRVGSANTAVLRFGGDPVVVGMPLTEWGTIVTTAEAGTVVRFTRRGVYSVKLLATVPASGAAAFGVGVNSPAAALLADANPINTTDGISVGAHAIAPASTQIPVTLETTVHVSDQQIGAGENVVYPLGNNGAGAALAAGGVISAQVRMEISYLGDLQGA